MGKPMSMDDVVHKLQMVLHDLADLSNFGDHRPFQGVVIDGLEFHYRDSPVSYWRISVEEIVGRDENTGQTITRRDIASNGG